MVTNMFRLSLLMGVVLLLSGCAHQLEIKNLRDYRTFQLSALEQPLTIGIDTAPMRHEELQLVKGVGHALGKYPTKVVLPYTAGNTNVDIVANIGIKSRYDGSGINFLINFPGFLVWAPAWNGYIYHATYDVDIKLTKAADGTLIDAWPMTIRLDLRHAEIDRTWTEISWFEVGAIAFIGGIAFIQYDEDVTPILIDEIALPIGEYIAGEIVNRIKTYQQSRPVAPNMSDAPAAGL